MSRNRIGDNLEADNHLGVGVGLEGVGAIFLIDGHYVAGTLLATAGFVCLRLAYQEYRGNQTDSEAGQQGSDTVQ